MLNITNYQRNANQNYNEVSPHTSQNGHSDWCEMISRCSFELNFLMINDVEHSFMCLLAICISLWRNVYLGLLPIFGLGCLFFWYWAAWVACMFWRFIFCQLLCLQIFSPILWVIFSFCLWFTLLYKSF